MSEIDHPGKDFLGFHEIFGGLSALPPEFVKSGFQKLTVASPFSGNLLMEIRKSGINHLILRFDLLNNWINASFDEQKKQYLSLFSKTICHIPRPAMGYI